MTITYDLSDVKINLRSFFTSVTQPDLTDLVAIYEEGNDDTPILLTSYSEFICMIAVIPRLAKRIIIEVIERPKGYIVTIRKDKQS